MKIVITQFLYLSRDAIHIHIGFLALVVTVVLSKKKLTNPRILLPGFVLSLLMEILDASQDITRSRLYPLEYLHDLVNTNFIPCMIVLLCLLINMREKSKTNLSSK